MMNYENITEISVNTIDGMKLKAISYKVSINIDIENTPNINTVLIEAIKSLDNKLLIKKEYVEQDENIVKIRTPALILQLPIKDVIISTIDDIERELVSLMKIELDKQFSNIIDIQIILNSNFNIKLGYNQAPVSYFNYNKNNKHIASGQIGLATIVHDDLYSPTCSDCQKGIQKFYEIAKLIDNTLFINRADIKSQNDEFIEIGYGDYYAKYTITMNNIIVIDNEPTLQNITDWIFNKGAFEFLNGHVKSLQLSQGFYTSYIKQVRF